ncbi:MAG: YdeI/OmpD-associated family protein [Microthrixaceae bacterium]|nr:YdeI/OmpD-associated family protein [Microthrixaceae bacterium]
MEDPRGVLEDQGPNSRSARRICFTSTDDVARLTDTVRSYLGEAIRVEEDGLELGPAPEPAIADELRDRLERDPAFRSAFEGLTPGRRREYSLYFSDAKQAKTREARIEKHYRRILDGKGLRDR